VEELLQNAARRSARYLADVRERGVAPSPTDVARLAALREPFPREPSEAADVLALLDEVGSPATLGIAGPRFFGFVIGGSLPAALAANWLAAAWDQNAAFDSATPAVSMLESVALEWLRDALGLPEGCAAGFVTGATMANFTSLVAARHSVLAGQDWDVEADGLFGAPPITVVIGEEAHPTLIKALGLVGFGRNRLVRVPVDGQGRMRSDALPRLTGATIVCAQAGNVNTGAVDPLPEIAARTAAAGAWLHVDGAFGLWAAAAPRRAHLLEGSALADSWATDAHKWLNVPYDSGLAFVRDADALRAGMAVTAEYLPAPSGVRNPSDFTPELSRRARGVEVWAALRSLGRTGLADLVERTCRHAERFAAGLAAGGYEILNEVVLNQVLVSFGEPELTQRVVAGIQADGTCWCGGTVWQGRTAMRISVSSWATTDDDVERSLEAILRIARGVRS
jgi:glutamate/tyrosine decarboxylase-like PLP-dependent enzyme